MFRLSMWLSISIFRQKVARICTELDVRVDLDKLDLQSISSQKEISRVSSKLKRNWTPKLILCLHTSKNPYIADPQSTILTPYFTMSNLLKFWWMLLTVSVLLIWVEYTQSFSCSSFKLLRSRQKNNNKRLIRPLRLCLGYWQESRSCYIVLIGKIIMHGVDSSEEK